MPGLVEIVGEWEKERRDIDFILNIYSIPGIALISSHRLISLILTLLKYKFSFPFYNEETVYNIETFVGNLHFLLKFTQYLCDRTRIST